MRMTAEGALRYYIGNNYVNRLIGQVITNGAWGTPSIYFMVTMEKRDYYREYFKSHGVVASITSHIAGIGIYDADYIVFRKIEDDFYLLKEWDHAKQEEVIIKIPASDLREV